MTIKADNSLPVETIQVIPKDGTKPCHFVRLPKEVTLLIFGWLDDKSKARTNLVCKYWQYINNSEMRYFKGQLEARIKVLAEIEKLIHTQPESCLKEAQDFLANPTSDFLKLELPSTPYKMTQLAKTLLKTPVQIFHKSSKPAAKQDLCLRLQQDIETIIKKDKYCSIAGHFCNFELYSNDPYELQGFADCLKPLMHYAIEAQEIEKGLPGGNFMFSYALPVFSAIMEGYTHTSKLKEIQFNLTLRKLSGIVEEPVCYVKNIDELPILNMTLPHFKHLEAIYFSNDSDQPVPCWTGGKGLDFIKNALISIPKLKKIEFDHLQVPIDKANAQV